MMEHVIGTGTQKSVRDVIRLAEKHLRLTEGVPRRITARSDHFEIIAERAEYEIDFDRFTLRIRCLPKRAESLRALAEKQAEACAIREEESIVIVQCPGEG